MMAFQSEQSTFVAALRHTDAPLPQRVSPRRMQVYQRLVYNNIDSLLSRGLPICQQLLNSSGQWRPLLEHFIASPEPLHSPYFADLSAALVRLLAQPTAALRALQLPAFIAELAHYEWLELAAQLAPQPSNHHWLDIDPLSDQQLLNSTITTAANLQLGHYHWPVMQISAATSKAVLAAGTRSEPLTIAVHCDATGRSHFTALNPLASALISQLQQQHSLPLQQHLQQLAQTTATTSLQQLLSHAPALVRQLAKKRLLGVSSSNEEA